IDSLSGNPAGTTRNHTYSAPGNYTISVSLTDEDGTFSNAGTLGVHVAAVSSFTVNDPGDNPDANVSDGVCETATGNGVCTLRAAIQEANALTGCGTIDINFGGASVSILGSALPDINHNVNINSAGASVVTVTRSTLGGTPNFRIFTVS